MNRCFKVGCAAKIPKDAYAEDITRLLKFLEGNHKQVLNELEKEMIQASQDQHFERAVSILLDTRGHVVVTPRTVSASRVCQ